MRSKLFGLGVAVAVSSWGAFSGAAHADTTLLNVSYDPTREFYADFNKQFAAQWQKDAGENISIRTSHGGSGAQAKFFADGAIFDKIYKPVK